MLAVFLGLVPWKGFPFFPGNFNTEFYWVSCQVVLILTTEKKTVSFPIDLTHITCMLQLDPSFPLS